MDKFQWQKLNEILSAAIELEPARQKSFLGEACNGDEELRREAEAMLAASAQAEAQGFLAQDAFVVGTNVLVNHDRLEDERIGHYKLIREIGRGGMGAVFLAEREDFRQQAAVKIIKRGMDTDEIVRRFERERDVLASLNHPNIARLLDGGTTDDGLPYIVMEYVEGEIITEFCDKRRLTIEERLEIFRKVCAAVAYAHQNLVIHRDIKPSNILIDADGEPKLLDFGIAKLLTADSAEQTATGANLMTPEYASPEQIRGERITTAGDIYSLGVLLYELLCGHRPFRFKNCAAGEVLQIISEQKPPAPSTAALTTEEIELRDGDTKQILSPDTVAEMRSEKPARLQRKLTGDLDNIVLMSLRKEPARRYESVQQFAEDVRRHLEGLPVFARPATFGYQVSKFVRRNRAAVSFAAVALLAMLIGFSVAVWQAVVAREERARAERRSDEIRRLTETLLKDLEKDVAALPGSDAARAKLSKVSIEYLNGLAQETNDPKVLRQLSEAYVLLGKQFGYASGDSDEFRSNISRGYEISRRLVADYPDDLEAKNLLAKNLEEYEFCCVSEPTQKVKIAEERARLREEIADAAPDDHQAFYELGEAYGSLNYLLSLYERRDEARSYRRLAMKASERQIQLLEKPSATERERDLLALAYMNLGAAYSEEFNDLPTAETNFRRALAVAETLVAEHPDYRLAWTRLSAANREIATIRYNQGDFQSALNYFRECLRLVRAANKQSTDVQMQVAEPNYMLRVAENLHRTGQKNEALQMMSDARIAFNRVNSIGQTSAPGLSRQAEFLRWSGETYTALGRMNEALANYREAESLWNKVLADDPKLFDEVNRQLARLYISRGNTYFDNRAGIQEARNQYQKAFEIFSPLKSKNKLWLDDLRILGKAQEKLQALEN